MHVFPAELMDISIRWGWLGEVKAARHIDRGLAALLIQSLLFSNGESNM